MKSFFAVFFIAVAIFSIFQLTPRRHISQSVNQSFHKNYDYEYLTIYTNGLTSKKLQNTIKKNIINGWDMFTITDGYVTMHRKCIRCKKYK